MKVIICGPRNCFDYEMLKEAVEKSGFEITEIVSGCAKGVDTLGEQWASEHGVRVQQFKPDWNDISVPGAVVKKNKFGQYNAVAGFDRNQKMAEYADACIAIHLDTNGTKDMIDRARKEGLQLYVHYGDDEGYVF
jgi:hypothetical protein